MANIVPLTDNKIKALKTKEKEYKVADGDGLYLHIMPNGSKLWRVRLTKDKKSTTNSCGKYPLVGLKEAREKRDAIKESFKSGRVGKSGRINFSKLVVLYLEHIDNLSANYLSDLDSLLKRDFIPLIGDMSIDDVKPSHIIQIFDNMEKRGLKSMPKKNASLISRIFKYAVTKQLTENNPVASIDFSILLKTHKEENFSHTIDTKVIKKILTSIDGSGGGDSVKTALSIAPYVFVRPMNLVQMEWDEIDFKNKLWTIPAEKMKMQRDHVVPLCDFVLMRIESMEYNRDMTRYVFPSIYNVFKHISRDSLNATLKRLGWVGVTTAHGFRHTASTILHENISTHGVFSDAIEMQLAHVDGNSVKGVYNKALYIKERIKLMRWWGEYLDALKASKSL